MNNPLYLQYDSHTNSTLTLPAGLHQLPASLVVFVKVQQFLYVEISNFLIDNKKAKFFQMSDSAISQTVATWSSLPTQLLAEDVAEIFSPPFVLLVA